MLGLGLVVAGDIVQPRGSYRGSPVVATDSRCCAGFAFRSRHSDAPESRSPVASMSLFLSLATALSSPLLLALASLSLVYVVYRFDCTIVANFARGRSCSPPTRATCFLDDRPFACALISRDGGCDSGVTLLAGFYCRVSIDAFFVRHVLPAVMRLRHFPSSFSLSFLSTMSGSAKQYGPIRRAARSRGSFMSSHIVRRLSGSFNYMRVNRSPPGETVT